jgi:hypothetical protein
MFKKKIRTTLELAKKKDNMRHVKITKTKLK